MFAAGHKKTTYEEANKLCTFHIFTWSTLYSSYGPAEMANASTRIQSKIIAQHFQSLLPIWLPSERDGQCLALLHINGNRSTVPCDKELGFVCERKMRSYALREPEWKQYLANGKDYALIRGNDNSIVFSGINYFEARYICQQVKLCAWV